jgi:hypothetical protein
MSDDFAIGIPKIIELRLPAKRTSGNLILCCRDSSPNQRSASAEIVGRNQERQRRRSGNGFGLSMRPAGSAQSLIRPTNCKYDSTRFRGQTSDSQVAIIMGSGNLQTVRMQVHVTGQAGKFKTMEILLGVRLPEDQDPAITTSTETHQ